MNNSAQDDKREDINQKNQPSTIEIFQRLRDEALDLEMTDKFLLSVEQKNRLVTGMRFEADRLYEALRILAAHELINDSIKIVDSELVAESELSTWRELLELRNNRIETFHIRRFYDNSDVSLDAALLVSLARVFRSLPYSESNQSKYDLVVTRLFTKGNVESQRSLRFSREKIREVLTEILPESAGKHPESEVQSAVEAFEAFILFLRPLSDLGEFLEKDSFERLRKAKKDLGDLFFHPRVTAAAIECNVTIGNVFAGLVNHVDGPFYNLINQKFDFAGVFHDVAPTARPELWREIVSDDEDNDSLNTNAKGRIREFLEMIGGSSETIEGDGEIQDLVSVTSETAVTGKSAGERVNPLLSRLSAESPDYEAIRQEADNYESLRSLDLKYILAGSENEVNEICRDVVAIIVWTEELCTNELRSDQPLSAVSKNEASTLIQLSEKYQAELQEMLEQIGLEKQRPLLLVSNRLLASHLDLKRLLLDYTKSNLDQMQIAEGDLDKPRPDQPGEVPQIKEVPLPVQAPKVAAVKVRTPPRSVEARGSNKWLIWATLVLAIFGGGIYYASQAFDSFVKDTINVEYLSVVSLPDGEHMKSAIRHQNRLVITAKDSWAKRTFDEQRESLRKLYLTGSDREIEYIVVTDRFGMPLGTASASGIELPHSGERNSRVQVASSD